MRTTLSIDDDVLYATKVIASMQNKSIGEVISALARQSLRSSEKPSAYRNGVPLLPVRAGAIKRATPELVKQLSEELL